MILRLSQKLAKKVDAGMLIEMPLDANPYADWTSHLFTADRTQYVIFSNTMSLYSCVTYGRGITNDGLLVERALDTIREFMQDDGQQFAYHKFIAPSGALVSLAKSLNRSVTGSMNDLVQGAKFHLLEDMSPHEVGFRLNETPLKALKDADGRKYATPREVFKRLIDTSIQCTDPQMNLQRTRENEHVEEEAGSEEEGAKTASCPKEKRRCTQTGAREGR